MFPRKIKVLNIFREKYMSETKPKLIKLKLLKTFHMNQFEASWFSGFFRGLSLEN